MFETRKEERVNEDHEMEQMKIIFEWKRHRAIKRRCTGRWVEAEKRKTSFRKIFYPQRMYIAESDRSDVFRALVWVSFYNSLKSSSRNMFYRQQRRIMARVCCFKKCFDLRLWFCHLPFIFRSLRSIDWSVFAILMSEDRRKNVFFCLLKHVISSWSESFDSLSR